ncbi:MAG TPA: folylpolyglutamate synthase/dihydrofolate synthase family protein [Bacillota bacterium]
MAGNREAPGDRAVPGVIKPGLERTRRLLDALGAPDRGVPCIVQVAGTNGKGSTAAMLEAILRAAGRRTALFTSPALEHEGGDLRLLGKPVGFRRLRQWAERVRAVAGTAAGAAGDAAAGAAADPPTPFELLTAAVVLAAREAAVDVLLLEAGMGGRLDATNAVARADLSVITSIDLDHRDWLGSTLEEIAREKAGIIRPGVPVVTSAGGEARAVVLAEAEARDAPMHALGGSFAVEGIRTGLDGTRFDLLLEGSRPWTLTTGLLGAHQAVNAATAAVAALALGSDRGAVERGLASVRWPGRCEVLRRRPGVLLDGAHNPAGMAALRRAVDDLFGDAPVVLVCGMLADKDVAGAASAWSGRARRAILVPPPNPRALDPQDLAAAFRAAGVGPVEKLDRWQEGLRRGLAEVEHQPDAILCVCGSLYLVGPARRLLRGLLKGL